jgi:prolyl 4-hydroxylase
MNWPRENGEALQILNYQPGAEYKAHMDYFDPNQKGSTKHLGSSGQRVSPLL